MIIQKIIAIAGKPGLYEVLATSRANLVVQSMLDGKRSSLPGSSRVSSLGDITMYTTGDDVLLMDVLNRMFEHTGGQPGVSHKASAGEIRDFIDGILPELDYDRVFNSDLKKLVQWYNVLVDKAAFPLTSENHDETATGTETGTETGTGTGTETETETEAPKKKAAAAKKPAAKKKPAAAAKKPAAAAKKPAAAAKKPAAAKKAAPKKKSGE